MRLKLCASSIHGKFQMCVAHSTVPWTLAFECFRGWCWIACTFFDQNDASSQSSPANYSSVPVLNLLIGYLVQ